MQVENMNFFTLTFTIFILLSAYAQIPVFLALLAPFEQKRQRVIIFREMLIALLALFIFILFGVKVLQIIGIKQHVIGIAGGFLLILIALNMIFPKGDAVKGVPQHEPFVVPLAIPCIAGPGAITSLIVLSKAQGILLATGALFVAWIPSTFILLMAPSIKNYLGDKGLQAVERLGGMVIVLIGIQMFANGVLELVRETFF